MQELVAGNREQLREASNGQGRVDGYMMPIGRIRVREGFNAHREADPDYPAHLRSIADKIHANGFRKDKTLLGTMADDGYFYITGGHTRYHAAIICISEGMPIENLPVINEEKGTTEIDRYFEHILGNSSKQPNPLGEAIVIRQIMGLGVSESEIQRRLGMAPETFNNRLMLHAAPTEIKGMVSSGEVAATEAIKAIKQHKGNATEVLRAAVQTAKAEGKTKATAKHIEPKKAPALHDDTVRLEYMADAYAAVRKCGPVGDQPEGFVCEDSQGVQLGWGVSMRGAIDNAISKRVTA